MKFLNYFEQNSPQKDQNTKLQCGIVQSVTCLAADTCLTADPWVASSIPVPVPYFHGD